MRCPKRTWTVAYLKAMENALSSAVGVDYAIWQKTKAYAHTVSPERNDEAA